MAVKKYTVGMHFSGNILELAEFRVNVDRVFSICQGGQFIFKYVMGCFLSLHFD